MPGDWIELHNSAATAIDLSGHVIKDNDDTHVLTLPAGSTIPAGGFLVIEESLLGFGLGAADAVRFYAPDGTLIDGHSWSGHALTTYGRCPDGSGVFKTTTVVTKGAANDCAVVEGLQLLRASVVTQTARQPPRGLATPKPLRLATIMRLKWSCLPSR